MKALGIVFLLGGVFLAFLNWSIVGWAVWGAPVGWALPSLLGSLLLIAAGVVWVINPAAGRWIAIIGLLLATVTLVQVANVFHPDVATREKARWLLGFAVFFVLLATALEKPTRLAARRLVLALALLVPAGYGLWAATRWRASGAYEQPQLVYLRYTPAPTLTLRHVTDPALERQLRDNLTRLHVTGTFDETGAQSAGAPKSVLAIAVASRPPDRTFPFPRGGFGLYLFDGQRWKTYPADLKTYSGAAYSTTTPDSSRHADVTWLYLPHSGGSVSGTPAFVW